MIKPKALKRGDTVAIVSLSSGMGGEKSLIHRYYTGINRLETVFQAFFQSGPPPSQRSGHGGLVHPALLGDGLHTHVSSVVEDHVLPLTLGHVLAQGVGEVALEAVDLLAVVLRHQPGVYRQVHQAEGVVVGNGAHGRGLLSRMDVRS